MGPLNAQPGASIVSDSVTKQCARAWHVPVCRHRCAIVCVGWVKAAWFPRSNGFYCCFFAFCWRNTCTAAVKRMTSCREALGTSASPFQSRYSRTLSTHQMPEKITHWQFRHQFLQTNIHVTLLFLTKRSACMLLFQVLTMMQFKGPKVIISSLIKVNWLLSCTVEEFRCWTNDT